MMKQVELLRMHFNALGAFENTSPCVLMLSCSNSMTRAVVRTVCADTFLQAWLLLQNEAKLLLSKDDSAGEHLRVDWAINLEQTTWTALKQQLSKTKRNYFTRGIGLDADLKHNFLWGEINGNAMLSTNADVEFAQINESNFNSYARKKYGKQFTLIHADDQAVWLFDTLGAYCGSDGEVHALLTQGVSTSRRELPNLNADSCAHLVTGASEFLARQVKEDGMFVYGLFPCFNREIPTYNTLRHVSSTYAMIEAWEQTQSEFLMAAIDRSLHCLTTHLIKTVSLSGGIQAAFLVDSGHEIKLGGNAVCILALAKYTELTGSARHLDLMELLAQGVVAMLNPNTRQFVHVLNYPELTVKAQFRSICYDGEAALALLRIYAITKRQAWLQAVELAFEYFIEAQHWKANDHWLSHCVCELTQYKPSRVYFEFGVRNFAHNLDVALARVTTFPLLLKLMMATEQMLIRLKTMPNFADLTAQVDIEQFHRAMHIRANYLLSGFFWPEWAMYFAKPDSILGSFFIRHHAYRVRIDDVGHCLSGLVAYRNFLVQNPACALTSAQINTPMTAPIAAPTPVPMFTPPLRNVQPAVQLKARLSEVSVWFLNQDFAFQRTGIENAALLRSQVFTGEMGLAPILLTCRYNPSLHESLRRLRESGHIPATQKCRSVYDFLQESEHVTAVLNTGESMLDGHQDTALNYPHLQVERVANTNDIRVNNTSGQRVMYLARNPVNDAAHHSTHGALNYINHFCNGAKFRKDRYDSRGFLSCMQYLHPETKQPLIEHYLRPNGSLAVAKLFQLERGKMVLQNVRLHSQTGDLLACLPSEQALVAYVLTAMLGAEGGKHVLVVDKNRLLYKPALHAQETVNRSHPNSVAVVPIIHAVHTTSVTDLQHSATNSNFKDILHDIQRPDAIVTLTATQKRDIENRYGVSRIFCIGHSYAPVSNPARFDERDRFRLVSMARYSPEKNQHFAIQAFVQVLKKYPQASLDFYGFGNASDPTLPGLRAQVQALGLQTKVRLNGWCNNTAAQYEAAGLSLLTSQGEAFSLAIMESLCHGCPPLAFDVPYGPGHLIESGKTGFLVPFGDVDALANSILAVFDNPQKHAEMSGQARAQSFRFAPSELARQWRDLFQTLGLVAQETAP